MNIVSETIASIYNFSDLHIGLFDIDTLQEYFLNSPASIAIFYSLKGLGIFLTIVLSLMFLITFFKTNKYLKDRNKLLLNAIAPPEQASSSPLDSKWEEIQRHLNSVKEAEWKFAVIEADSLVDYILKSSGYPGETMGERLKNIDKTQIVTLDGLWEAHKIRNRLAHDPNYFLRYGEAKRAVQLYGKTLEELKAL